MTDSLETGEGEAIDPSDQTRPQNWSYETAQRVFADRLSDEADLCRNDGADDIARLLDEAAANDRAQAAEIARLRAVCRRGAEAMLRLIGTLDDPNAGWRGSEGTDELFACEFCGQKHIDCTKVPHMPHCPIPAGFDALSELRAAGGEG